MDFESQSLARLTEKLAQLNAQLANQARSDFLTGLLNRRGLDEAAKILAGRASREGTKNSVILLDLDDFKGINDHYGHVVGDEVLRMVARTIQKTVRTTDVVSRVGGDEFIILLPDTNIAEASLVAEKVRLAISSSPMPLSNGRSHITSSSGLISVEKNYSSVDEMLSDVRMLLKRSKLSGKNNVAGKSEEIGSIAEKVAFEGGKLAAVSQPIFDLVTLEAAGREMLIRVVNGVLRGADELFSSAIEGNLLHTIDMKAFRECVATASAIPDQLPVHLNIFPSTLLVVDIEGILAETRKLNRPVVVEISEQQFIGDPEPLLPVVKALRDGGVTIAIDDIGFGRSSLEALVMLEPEIVKIDREYVSGCDTNKQKQRCLKRLIGICDQLGAKSICEGVETQGELDVVRSMGAKLAQGYLFGRPT